MKVICEQYRDGVPDGDPLVVPPLNGETTVETLARKLAGAIDKGWTVLTSIDSFHAWKIYSDGDGTHDRPNRKDRYFSIR